MRRRCLADVTGAGVLDRETEDSVRADVAELSEGTLTRMNEDS